ncbi:MAG: hypothetical protein QNJ14_15545 [Woeseiaceae bacterium]|nr:hypothetical protein [Woeseiaceae bacterium]
MAFDTSIPELKKALWFVAIAAASLSIVGVAFTVLSSDGPNAGKPDVLIRAAVGPFVILGTIGGIFVTFIGLIKVIRFVFVRADLYRQELTSVEFVFWPYIVGFLPSRLSDRGREARIELIDALKWLLAAVCIALVVQFMTMIGDRFA